MSKFETVSVALFATVLLSAPVLAWTLMMYRTLKSTGLMIAAIS